MSDREMVIKAYECCKNSFDRICGKCPYEKVCCHDGIPMFVIKKMVTMLKEQEEQEPLAVYEGKVNKCVCGNEINRYWHPEYCGFCGKKLLWY